MTTSTTIELISKRRTQYALGKNLPISQDEVINLAQKAIKLAPSSFNSQTSRAVILFGEQSEKLWSITKETLRKLVPADAFATTEAKMNSFAAGAGTILFYEDQDAVKKLQESFPLYADNFPIFSQHSAGMAQFAVWTALAEAGIGASLQHYNPLIDNEVAKTWDIPSSWKLIAQMPFGSNEAPFAEKTFIDDSARFKVFG
ncbi:nitroreductase family protein [Paenochrobactrum sp. BZR 588]|uniref:nitroreductase family protein n=1 Tax=Paenochrobactrum TaxID=999488 RepID=UPI0035BBD0E5